MGGTKGVLPPKVDIFKHLPKGHPLSWTMLVVTTLATLTIAFDRMLLPTVLPDILKEFLLSPGQGGVLIGLSYAGTVVGGLILGIFGDALGKGAGRAWAWIAAVVVVILSAVLTAFTRSLGRLQILRVLMGIGTGGMEPENVAMVGEWWQKDDRGFAVGVHHTGFPFGQFLGPVLIGVVLAAATWREVFLFIPVIALPIAAAQLLLARRRNLEKVNGWILEHGMTPSVDLDQEPHQTKSMGISATLKSARVALANRNVLMAVVLNFMFLYTETSIISFLTLQLTRDVGIALASAAVIAGASGITGWVGQIVWGTVSDHTGRKSSLRILAIGMAVTIALMIFIQSAGSAWIILLGWGLFRNSPYPVMYASIIDSVPESASSGLGLMIGVGLGASGLIAAPLAGVIVEHFGFTWHYLILSAICLLALVPISLIQEEKRDAGAAGVRQA